MKKLKIKGNWDLLPEEYQEDPTRFFSELINPVKIDNEFQDVFVIFFFNDNQDIPRIINRYKNSLIILGIKNEFTFKEVE